jgi:serine/threonine-protein kinase HipA
MSRRAEVRVEGLRAGWLLEGEETYRFQYDPAYLTLPQARPVSLTLPLRAEPFEDKRLFPFFDGLIPEGWLLEIAERTWKLNPRDRMGLLLACCRHCIGTVEILPAPEAASP